MGNTIRYAIAAAIFGGVLPITQAEAATLVVDVAGAQSYAGFGDARNTVQTFTIGALSRITAVALNVTITAFDPSYLSEATLTFTGSNTGSKGVILTPGTADNFSGTKSYSSFTDLIEPGFDFAVGIDGILRLEYAETFDDGVVAPDALWTSGTLTFTYDEVTAAIPEPATWLMMIAGFTMVGGAARYRRRATTVRYA